MCCVDISLVSGFQGRGGEEKEERSPSHLLLGRPDTQVISWMKGGGGERCRSTWGNRDHKQRRPRERQKTIILINKAAPTTLAPGLFGHTTQTK